MSAKNCDKQITPTDRVSNCCPIDHVSCVCGIITQLGFNANGLVMFFSDYTLNPFASQKPSG